MYLRLQKYDVKIIYVQESRTLFIADALLYLTKSVDVPNDVVGKEGFSIQLEETNLVAEVPIADVRLDDLRRETAADRIIHFQINYRFSTV